MTISDKYSWHLRCVERVLLIHTVRMLTTVAPPSKALTSTLRGSPLCALLYMHSKLGAPLVVKVGVNKQVYTCIVGDYNQRL